MRYLLLISTIIFSFSACSKEAEKVVIKKDGKFKSAAVTKKNSAKTEVPCDTKEDILKKLEEKKKTEAETGKAFSLQGGNTGCSVK